MWLRRFLVWARPLFVALAIYLAVAVVYLQVVPPLEGFDSIPHQNYVNYLRSTGHLPRIEPEAAIFSYQLVQHPPLYYLVAAALTLPFDYANWDTHVRAQENVYFGTLSNRWSVDLPNPPPGLVASQWITRLLALLGGALAVVGAWLWTRTVLYRVGANLSEDDTGGMGGFGLAVVMLFALNPLFLFISTTVTNDSWAIMGAVWVMWLTTVLARHPQSSLWRWVALGLVAGAAALIKYNVLVLIFPVAAALVFAYRHAWRRLVLGTLVAMVSALAVAGYWYFRNLYLYGEPIPWTRLGEVISTLERDEAMPWGELLSNLDWLFYSYWGVFVSIFAPEPFFAFWKWFCLICALGLVVALIRASTTAWRMRIGPALIWLVGVVLATIYWARTISYGEQARLALIAGPALALLLSLGWRALVPTRAVGPLAYVLVAVLIAVSLWPVPTLQNAYRVPPPVDAAALPAASATYQPSGVAFAPGMELVGFDLPQGRVLDPHEARPLWLYWRTATPIVEDYTLFVHIAGADDTIWYQYDGVPAQGNHTTRQWQPGQTFAMRLDIAIEDEAADAILAEAMAAGDPATMHAGGNSPVVNGPGMNSPDADNSEEPGVLALLSVGFYVHDDPAARVAVDTENGAHDRLVLADLRFVPGEFVDNQMVTAPQRPLAAWQNGIVLQEAATTVDVKQGRLWLDAEWNTGSLLAENLSVFIHMVDDQGTLITQVDGEPAEGSAPTATWLPGQDVADRYMLQLPSTLDLVEDGPFYLHIGWYDVQTGERVARAGASEHADFVRWPVNGESQPGVHLP